MLLRCFQQLFFLPFGLPSPAGVGRIIFFSFLKADKEVSEKSLFDAIQDTEAFVVANDDAILVVFRGTSELTDWITNLSFRTRNIPAAWGFGDEDCDVHQVRLVKHIHMYRYTVLSAGNVTPCFFGLRI